MKSKPVGCNGFAGAVMLSTVLGVKRYMVQSVIATHSCLIVFSSSVTELPISGFTGPSPMRAVSLALVSHIQVAKAAPVKDRRAEQGKDDEKDDTALEPRSVDESKSNDTLVPSSANCTDSHIGGGL
jgi:hypothetical protein